MAVSLGGGRERNLKEFELIFQLFTLVLGLSMAELLIGLARSWRIQAGAVGSETARIRIGWLIPLLGLLLLLDQTRFWTTAYAFRNLVTFEYATLLAVLAIVGGYFTIATFVFPDEPAQWPNFDDYFFHVNRTVVGGMIVVNLAIFICSVFVMRANAIPWEAAPIAKSLVSQGAALIFLPGLIALWFLKSKRASLVLLIFMNAVLLSVAIGEALH